MKPSLVIAGLGNPGASYAHTRHNLGFRSVELLAESFAGGAWKDLQKFSALGCEARVLTFPVLLLKPSTYVNRSGEALRKVTAFYKLHPQQILVIVDDVDLPLGAVRLRKRGGPGTHNGMKSVVDALGEDFPRVRIGLGSPPEGTDLAAWVLSVPPPEEAQVLEGALKTLPDIIRRFVLEGREAS